MDPKYYPIPKINSLTIDPQLEKIICSGLMMPAAGLRGDLTFMMENYAEIKDKLHCISINNPCTQYVLGYWKDHEKPPACINVREHLERMGSEDGLAFYLDVLSIIQNPDGTPKKNAIPSAYSFAGRVDEAVKETTKNYVQFVTQKAWEIHNSGVTIEIGKKRYELKGTDDYIAYNTYATNNIPTFKNLQNASNSYLEAGTLNYLAYPYLAIGDTTILVGPSTVGKTMTILDSMTSVMIGNKIFGRLDIMQDHHIHLFTELSNSSIKERLRGINKALDTTKTRIYCLPEIGDVPDYQLFFTKMVQYSEIPKLIYVDNISSWCKIDLNRDQDMAQMHTFFRHLAIATNSCFVLLCHTRKRSNNRKEWGEKQLDDIAGSRLLYALADAVLLFDEVIDEDKKRIRGWGSIDFFKRKDLTRAFYNIDESAGAIQYHDDLPLGLVSDKEEKLSNDMVVLQAIQDSDIPMTRSQLEKVTGLSKATMCRILNILKLNYKIFQNGKDNSPGLTYGIRVLPPKHIDPEQLLMDNLGDEPKP